MTSTHVDSTTDPPEARPRKDQRLLTQLEASNYDQAKMLLAQREHLGVARALASREATDLASVRACFVEILAGGSPASWARAGLNYLARAGAHRQVWREHLDAVGQVLDASHDVVKAIGAAIEGALVGRQRSGVAPCMP